MHEEARSADVPLESAHKVVKSCQTLTQYQLSSLASIETDENIGLPSTDPKRVEAVGHIILHYSPRQDCDIRQRWRRTSDSLRERIISSE